MSEGIGRAVRKARESMKWPVSAVAQAAHVSNKSWGQIENDSASGQTDSSRRRVIALLEAYGFSFNEEYTELVRELDEDERFFLMIDLRYTDSTQSVAEEMERGFRAIGYCVVIKRNLQRITGSKYDTIVVHVPPLNVKPLEIRLGEFVDRYGDILHARVRDRRNVLLTKDTLPSLFDT